MCRAGSSCRAEARGQLAGCAQLSVYERKWDLARVAKSNIFGLYIL